MSEESLSNLRPGKVLKALREERKLSLESLADQTKIPIKKLQWIDQDDYSKFDAPVFVRGYIRNYAKYVEADADNLIGLYDQLIGEDSESIEHVNEEAGGQPSPTQRAVLKFLKSFIDTTPIWSVAAILVALWLIFRFFAGDSAPQVSAITPTSSEQTEIRTPSVLPQSVSATDQNLQARSGQSELEFSETSVNAPATPIASNADSMAANQSIEPSSAATISSAAVEDSQQTTVSSDRSELAFSFSDECWVEVRDANDERIFADIKNKGDNLRLFGSAPFNIMLGNARAVELTIDGAPVELRLNGGRKTLRLSVFAN